VSDGASGGAASSVGRAVLLALGALAALAVVYGGAYLGLVVAPDPPAVLTFTPTPQTAGSLRPADSGEDGPDFVVDAPSYRAGGTLARRFFAPAFAIDLRLRPARWRVEVVAGPPRARPPRDARR
jgi:hypothetical protein